MGENEQAFDSGTAAEKERQDILRMARVSVTASAFILALLAFGSSWIVSRLFGDLGPVEFAGATASVALALSAIPSVLMYRTTMRYQFKVASKSTAHELGMLAEARRREFETRLARALEMTDEEPAAYDVIQRAMHTVVPDVATELLLADNSHAHLERVVVASDDGVPGCAVTSPDQCVAARRAQTQVFPDSEDLDACPMLRGREVGQCSGVCVPVSIMGRTVGVLHSVGPVNEPLDDLRVTELQTLANQAGNRLGMLRVMAETQVQASTDGLTGLINRRSLENKVRQLRADGAEMALVMADLDHFKALNDSYGHESGDRALRIFSETLRQEVRAADMACRYGGEEFAIVLPGADLHEAVEIVERIREGLARATARGDAPNFTSSFGIAHSSEADDFEDLMQRADKALFNAKDAGRDRICLDGHNIPVAQGLSALG
jgi:diguanylate cyclase (GGDEF)-like protein